MHHGTGIECLPALAAYLAQGRGERRITHPVADLRRLTPGQHHLGSDRVLQFLPSELPIPGDPRGNPVALLSGTSGGLQEFGERLRAMLPVERAPSVAIGAEVAIMPFSAIAADRPTILKSRMPTPQKVVTPELTGE